MFDNIQNKGGRSDGGPSLLTPRNVSKLINNKGMEEKSIYLLACDFLPLGCFPKVVDRLSIVGKQRKSFEAEEDKGKRELALLVEARDICLSCTGMHRNLGKLGRRGRLQSILQLRLHIQILHPGVQIPKQELCGWIKYIDQTLNGLAEQP